MSDNNIHLLHNRAEWKLCWILIIAWDVWVLHSSFTWFHLSLNLVSSEGHCFRAQCKYRVNCYCSVKGASHTQDIQASAITMATTRKTFHQNKFFCDCDNFTITLSQSNCLVAEVRARTGLQGVPLNTLNNLTFSFICWNSHRNSKYGNFTLLFLRELNGTKLPHLQHIYFSSLDQSNS